LVDYFVAMGGGRDENWAAGWTVRRERGQIGGGVRFNLATCIPEIHRSYDLSAGTLCIPNAGALMFFTGLAVRRTYR